MREYVKYENTGTRYTGLGRPLIRLRLWPLISRSQAHTPPPRSSPKPAPGPMRLLVQAAPGIPFQRKVVDSRSGGQATVVLAGLHKLADAAKGSYHENRPTFKSRRRRRIRGPEDRADNPPCLQVLAWMSGQCWLELPRISKGLQANEQGVGPAIPGPGDACNRPVDGRPNAMPYEAHLAAELEADSAAEAGLVRTRTVEPSREPLNVRLARHRSGPPTTCPVAPKAGAGGVPSQCSHQRCATTSSWWP
ncbi:hypothetical protein MAPG_04858 [Magnaporthiopsis poae ATCC 64411]|uniref:Uncharacterized protein n=1 Tax=Magnaporthiopsis poae (strain ATCC 64411 / 73-15) TaxID=644358 RepID=A0A0C4DXV1_MAGP6|nr:hypothetical protein MAPG_04858 [Magnaporthiopsis poae ATCC 64411]